MSTIVHKPSLQLLHGTFNSTEAIELITRLIHQKIRFHEEKLCTAVDEDERIRHERRIRELQRDLYNAREYIEKKRTGISLEGTISLG